MEDQEIEKGEMLGSSEHSFFVVNLTSDSFPKNARIIWSNSSQNVYLDVGELPPCTASVKKEFFPASGKKDYWRWNLKGREYQLNCYDSDRYVVITISDYGIGVIPTGTAPDTWKW